MSTEIEMRQDRFSIIFKHLISIKYDNQNIWMTFKFADVRDILVECSMLFDEINNITIDGREYEPKFDSLPKQGGQITILTSSAILGTSQIFVARNIHSATNKYMNRLINPPEMTDLSGWTYLIEENYSSIIPNTFLDVDASFAVFEKLSQLSDHKFSGIMAFLCGKTILEVPSSFNINCVLKLKNAKDFLDTNFNKSNPELNIFKSVLYENLSIVDMEDRLEKFFSRFDIILQEFKVSCSIHYEKYNLNLLKKDLDESFIALNEKIKKSVDNVKGELILIVSMAFALSQFDLDWSGSMVNNIIIFVSLILASIIYSFLIHYDKRSLNDLNKIVDEENDRLKEIMVEEKYQSDKSQMISKDVEKLKDNIKSHHRFLTFCLISIWLPLFILILGIIYTCMTQTPEINRSFIEITHSIVF
ncbi:MAG: hypothetical protein JJE49_03595 [Peptostreptococcaceae bacterium]|nr:hypothetical protein [Peptostreptococcaceae bacterium]